MTAIESVIPVVFNVQGPEMPAPPVAMNSFNKYQDKKGPERPAILKDRLSHKVFLC
jgi:hypothetical protein